MAYNPWGRSHAALKSIGGELFNLDSFWLAGAWGSQTLTITGYVNGIEVNSALIRVSIAAQEYFFSGFEGIDTFVIATGNDYMMDSSVTGYENILQWALGSVTITVVPEPEAYLMLLAGLGVVGAVSRRRRTKTAM